MTRESPLKAEHLAAGAKLVDFAGWNMPLAYPAGTVVEHNTVRSAVGLFDVTHLGKVTVEGPGAEALLDRLLPGKVVKLKTGKAGYNLVLTEDGGVVDDIFVYKRQDGFLVVPNASNTDAVIAFLQANAGGDVTIADARGRWGILALSGPRAREVLFPLLPEAEGMKMHDFATMSLKGIEVIVARTGYTGEVTYEFLPGWDRSPDVWNLLLQAGEPFGIKPAGLGARDTLRLEMGYPLHGHELSVDINPLEAGLGWVVDWDKDFFGKPALERVRSEGPARKLVGLLAEPGRGRVPRMDHQVFFEDRPVGKVTSGNYSPTLGAGIALAFVPPELSEVGTRLEIDVRGRRLEVQVVKLPFKTG
ncbi:MAG TPA: glycine cleavage system aminomethyltransferase GcvT [Actinomycetota bacterium]|nr:glycine cleavage system aminomethyltransferase GcvT [Actinomycetota bacterium]